MMDRHSWARRPTQRLALHAGKRALLLATVTLGITAQPVRAAPQDSSAQSEAATDEIIVTARRQQESAQSVPVSVAAFTGEKLQSLGVVRSTDIPAITTNFTVNSGFGASNPMLYIRGVGSGNYNDNAQSNVGTYLDDVYLSAPAGKLLQMFDVENVQVLKGPQGTLFGRNNTAGALLISSKLPGDQFEGYLRGSVGSFDLVRRQNIWRNSRRKLAECGPRLGVDVRRRACGEASADVRWSAV